MLPRFLCKKPHYAFVICVVFTCVMEPPGLVEEMSGGGSGMPLRGLTAASLVLSCGRLGSEWWPGCWNAER